MNVLHINQSDILGGAAIAGYRLHKALHTKGVDSRLLVGSSELDDNFVEVVPRSRSIENLFLPFTQFLGLRQINYLGTFAIRKHKFYQDADVINFHNLHTGYFNYLAIPALTAKKPAVLTLHDMWSFTGHCAFSFGYECDRWKIGCSECPHPNINPPVNKSNTRIEWKLKQWVYRRSNLHIVAPSEWLVGQARKSMLKRFPIHHIPHGIDTEVFQPLDSGECRSHIGVPDNKYVILYGAYDVNVKHKGADLLLKALIDLPERIKANSILLIFGKNTSEIEKKSKIPVINLGYINDDRLKVVAYSAADLFVSPTRADVFGLVLMESMSCGTPMVAFNVGGVSGIVRSNITGYLAEYENITDFNKGIIEILDNESLRHKLKSNCRKIALKEYNLDIQTMKYIELYRKIIEKTSTNTHLD